MKNINNRDNRIEGSQPKQILLKLLQSTTTSLVPEVSSLPFSEIADLSRFISESIIQLYANHNSINLLTMQLKCANLFIAQGAVQAQVSKDFNEANYTVFDPNNGDNNCESRCFLLEIFNKQTAGLKYENLEPEEKLVLTLSHVLSFYKLEKRDIFDLLVYEKQNSAKISYKNSATANNIKLASYNVMPKNEKYKEAKDIAASAADLMANAMGEISVNFLKQFDELYNKGEFSEDLLPYQRKLGKRLLPPQVLSLPTYFSMLNFMKVMEMPLIYKITRLETILSNETLVFKLQGVGFIVRMANEEGFHTVNPQEAEELKDMPAGIFEIFSLDTEANRKQEHVLKPLARATSFEDYISALSNMGIDMLLLAACQAVDIKLNPNKKYCASTLLSIESIEGLGGYYALQQGKEFVRKTEGAIFSPCHFYISTYNTEQLAIDRLPRGLLVGAKVEPCQIKER